MTRLTMQYGDVTTELRVDDTFDSFEGLETFVRIVWEQHQRAITFAVAVEAAADAG